MSLPGRIATVLGIVAAALVLGLGSAWWAVASVGDRDLIRNGPWRTSLAIGSANANMYLRASVAIGGLFALNQSEAVYFFASTDDTGAALRARCSYAIEGRPVAARWWSLTAYGADNFLIPNAANRFSFNMANHTVGEDGTFRVTASPTAQGGQWLPTGTGSGGFNLAFRLYNPAGPVLADLAHVGLPSIRRTGACT